METLIRLGVEDAGEVLTLQRAAYVPEAQLHGDLLLPPLCQTLAELGEELADPATLALGYRTEAGRLVASVRFRADPGDLETAVVHRLVVAPDRQGEGLGSEILLAGERRLPGTMRHVRLFTGERSARTLRLYARLGYVESHRDVVPAGYQLVHLRKRRRQPDGQ